MRVTVNYGMDFKDIPELLQRIVTDCDDKLKKIDGLLSMISYSIVKEKGEMVSEATHDLRLVLNQIDLEMAEINILFQNYIGVKQEHEASTKNPRPPVEIYKSSEEPASPEQEIEPDNMNIQTEVDLGIAVDPTVDDLGSQ